MMQPFYFGTSANQLFGAYHAPEGAGSRNGAVVLCQPLCHEYLRAHRAFRNLAMALAAAGLHVLRFDYLGSGDSSGRSDETTVAQCLSDISVAIDELKDISGVSKVSLIGLRFGAALAVLAASRRKDVKRIVLWDPVTDGQTYVNEVLKLQERWVADRLGQAAANSRSRDDEFIGFPLTAAILDGLCLTSLMPPPSLGSVQLSLFVSEDRPCYEALRRALSESGEIVTKVIAGSGDWATPDAVHSILLPHAMIRAIVAAVTEQPGTPARREQPVTI